MTDDDPSEVFDRIHDHPDYWDIAPRVFRVEFTVEMVFGDNLHHWATVAYDRVTDTGNHSYVHCVPVDADDADLLKNTRVGLSKNANGAVRLTYDTGLGTGDPHQRTGQVTAITIEVA